METGLCFHCFLTGRLGGGQSAVRPGQHRRSHVFCGYGPGRAQRNFTNEWRVLSSGHSETLPGGEEVGVDALLPVALGRSQVPGNAGEARRMTFSGATAAHIERNDLSVEETERTQDVVRWAGPRSTLAVACNLGSAKVADVAAKVTRR